MENMELHRQDLGEQYALEMVSGSGANPKYGLFVGHQGL
jgi:hypothetical protein